jgi:hypothetical protein
MKIMKIIKKNKTNKNILKKKYFKCKIAKIVDKNNLSEIYQKK